MLSELNEPITHTSVCEWRMVMSTVVVMPGCTLNTLVHANTEPLARRVPVVSS